MSEANIEKERPHSLSASEMRIIFSIYGPLMREDFNKILERKKSLPLNFKNRLRSGSDDIVENKFKKI